MTILCGFVGTLTVDAQNKISAAGKNWTSLNVKVGDGKNTQWLNCAVFGDDAASVAALRAGAAVYIEGRLELRRWENHGGHKMSGLSVAASFCRPIDLRARPHRESNKSEPDSASGGGGAMSDNIPFGMEWRG
jgi:single-stranded DNA-binding protein